jgi:branched-chain amino acid transport system ATP-binding protein
VNSPPILEVTQLNAGYGELTILRDCSVHLDAGEVTGVIGANGAGKSTFLRSISRLTTIQSGDLRVLGESVVHLRPQDVAAMGVAHVPEGRHIFKDLSVRDNLLVGGFIHRERTVDVDLLEEIAPILLTRLRQPGGTLSGGEQQLLAICRAMMQRPQLLLLDEPSQGLSPAAITEVCRAIDVVSSKGTAVLLAEQNAAMIKGTAGSVLVMGHGEIVQRFDGQEVTAVALAELLVE